MSTTHLLRPVEEGRGGEVAHAATSFGSRPVASVELGEPAKTMNGATERDTCHLAAAVRSSACAGELSRVGMPESGRAGLSGA